MIFETIEQIKEQGFKGFIRISELMNSDYEIAPKEKGIYLILHLEDEPVFLNDNVGGHFKNRNPTVSQAELLNNWVDNLIVLYIGKAGGGNSKATLNSRIKDYMKFGSGQPIGHWGGRLIWQLSNYMNLIVCWKETPNDDPREIEKDLIKTFVIIYCRGPG
jgi:hypothetical protein